MITFFSTPKPFVGHINTIQRNAIRSWQRIHPDAEVLLVGDDPGTPEVCREFGIQHIQSVAKNQCGTKYLASIYDQAQEVARHEILCHVNCDIVLLSDFRRAIEYLLRTGERFVAAGRRWDVDLSHPLNFEQSSWEQEIRHLAMATNRQRPAQWMDYFVFNRGLYYHRIPQFVIGRPGWDPWLLWFALSLGARVVDASPVVLAVHQNHDYSYHPDGEAGVWQGQEAQENYRLLKGKFRKLDHATHVLGPTGLKTNYRRWWACAKQIASENMRPTWYLLLELTKPARHRLGLRRKPS